MTAAPAEQFRVAISEAGLEPPVFINPDSKLHRFSSDGRRGDVAGWYIFHSGDISAGAFGCWRAGISETWRADIGRELTKEEVAVHRRQMENARHKREAKEKKLKAKARERAAKIWQRAASAPEDHPYLAGKGIKAHGLKVDHGELAVPLRDSAGVLHSLQFIAADGAKNYLLDGRASGCFFMIGEPNGALCIAEGFATAASIHEATGHAVAVAFNSKNLIPVTKALRAKFPDLRLIVCADDDAWTKDNPGMRDGREAAAAAGALMAAPDFGPNRPDDATDFNDLGRIVGPDAVRECVSWAAPVVGEISRDAGHIDVDAEIKRLARLKPVDYDRVRKEEAARLGIRATTLDKEVSAERPQDVSPGSGRPLAFDELEPWPEPVNGADLLSAISDAIRKYVVLSKEDADTVALWCLHTFSFDAFSCTPRLAITSPQKRCGKTTLLDVIEALVARPLQTANISAAAVFRTVEICKPTLLIDEADTFLADNEELRGVLNSGHRRGGQVIRTVGDDFEPRAFSTFSPCVVAMIGKLPETLADRSVAVCLKRRLPSEPISRFRSDRIDGLKILASKAARWKVDNAVELGRADPDLPESIFNREADNWRPLFAIAAIAGSDWPARVKKAAMVQTGAPGDGESLNVQLLADIREVIEAKGLTEDDDGLPSKDLVAALVAMEERPWGECSKHGTALTQNALARRLKPFEIRTGEIHVGHGRQATKGFKGYELKSFKESFSRYLPVVSSAQPRNGNDNNDLEQNRSAQRGNGCADKKSANQVTFNTLRGCADEKGGNGQREHLTGSGADDADAKIRAPEKRAARNWQGRT